MAALLLVTPSPTATAHGALPSPAQLLPALEVLPHRVRVLPADVGALLDAPPADAVLVDGRADLAQVRSLTRLVRTTGITVPLLLILTEGALAVVADDWGMDDVLLVDAGPGEVDARLRLATSRLARSRGAVDERQLIRCGGLSIDEASYTARLGGRSLDLTFKEFELVKFLAQHPGRVFTRQHLVQEVWGYDYFGGTRTVDVHVRRLRAKLGPEHERLISTVRNVGYRLDAAADRREPTAALSRSNR